ncbi:DUF2987 domain-containing protein [Shewanella psychrotolerans]|uniref:DUF2987 domain-containing protein n=1 Tax=Shewanella psychrotolerans TaxID=2864206 RepID=UPI001C65FC6B|nr:DUF2987 domain-containing protein [Shewanella psychrotolerans]QYK03087.1 DUF2987 domain-containing protein [Shewanella psychrotolerans]
MNKGLLFSCLFAVSFVAQSSPISLEYQGFYQRLKQVNKGHYPLIELVFSVPKDNGCIIQDGFISTEKERFPLTITAEQRVFIPFDERLKSDRALINLQMENDASLCGVAMQIRAKRPMIDYGKADLLAIQSQMDELLHSMQGFPMRYFTDDIAGVSFEFVEPASVTIDGKMELIEGTYRLSRQHINTMTKLSFSREPNVISPWINH